jgi:hypothetical protein
MAPGPAIRGVASGNTETSGLAAASARSSAVVVVPPDARANTMSTAISSSSTPPAVRRAGRVIPNARSTPSPSRAKNRRIPAPIRQPLRAMARRSRAVFVGVSAGNSAAVSSGPMVAKKVVKATSAASSMADGFQHGRPGPDKRQVWQRGKFAGPAHRIVTAAA